MGKDFENVFRELKDDVASYAELKLELLKLNTYERISKVIAILSYGLLLSAMVILVLLFAMLALGFLFSLWVDSMAIGFGIVAVLYLILVVIVISNKKRICLKVINVIISTLDPPDKKNETTNAETEQAADAD
jgi:hypothetical protein